MIQPFRFVLVAVCACAFSAPALAADYYVSTTGNDANSGRTTALAWRSLARVNSALLRSGDRVLLQGGATFTGSLTFDTSDGGTPAAPLTVTSYGTGRATVQPYGTGGISVYNRAALRLANLRVVGDRTAGASGISFYMDLAGTAPLSFVRIEDVEVSGFAQDGIQVGTWNNGAGFSDVRIVRTLAHDNVRTGILTFADRPNVHRGVYIGYSRAFNNRGARGTSVNTGSGIVLGNVNGGTIERSVAHHNGDLCDATEGPVGIWAYDSTGILIQHNESYANRTGGGADGGGFDFDQNVSASVMQFNYSHDNDGAGYLLAHRFANDEHRGNSIRYNISRNDGRRNGYSGIEVWGRTVDTAIYHNTVVISAAPSGVPRAFRLHNASIAGVRSAGLRLLNNLFYTRDALTLVDVSADQQAAGPLTSAGNGLYSPTTTTGHPGLIDAFGGGTLDDATRLETLDAFRLAGSSPVRDGGVDVRTFGAAPAPRDFFGGVVDFSRPGPGVHEFRACVVCTDEQIVYAMDAVVVAGAWRLEDDASAAGGRRLRHPDAAAPKLAAALVSPAHYFEMDVDVDAGRLYRLWVRGRADGNGALNDSVFAQFAEALDPSGRAAYRLGTTSALAINLEPCSGCGLGGWMWRESGWGTGDLGPLVRFATSGRKRVRIQTREDGIAIDQLVLSPEAFVAAAPGLARHDATTLARTGDAAVDVVVRASDVQPSERAGAWTVVADVSAAAGVAVWNPDRGLTKRSAPLPSPPDYVDFRFAAEAGTSYRLWLRLRAQNDSGGNDSIFVQLDDRTAEAVVLQDATGASIRGWGWNDTGWASLAAPVTFTTSGLHRLRIQPREDGVFIDQVVLSPARYFDASPGAKIGDTTIVPRP
jgi:hypothetical protein